MIERQYPKQPANLEYLPPELRFQEMVPPDIRKSRIEASIWDDLKHMLSAYGTPAQTVKNRYIAAQNIGERTANISATMLNTIGQIAAWTGAGALGFGALGSIGVAMGAGNIVDALIPTRAIAAHFTERRALEGVSKAIMPGAFSTDLSGRGFTRNQAELVLKHFQGLQTKYNTSFEDLQRNLTDFVNFGLISGVSSVSDFEKKFDILLGNVKSIMKTLHTTQEKALTMIKTFEMSGVQSQNVPYLISQTQQYSYLTGESVPDIMKKGLAFARTFQGTGMTGTAGYNLGTGLYTALRTASISGAIDQNTLWQYGGVQNAAAQAMQRSVQYFNTPLGDINLRAGMTAAGGFDLNRMMSMSAGSPFASIGAAASVMSNPSNYLAYVANKEKYMSKLFTASPAAAPAMILKSLEDQMRAAGIRMTYTNLVGFGKLRGVDVNLIAPVVASAQVLPTSAQEEFKRRVGIETLSREEVREWNRRVLGIGRIATDPFTKLTHNISRAVDDIGYTTKTAFIRMADNISDSLDMHRNNVQKFTLTSKQINDTIKSINDSSRAISDSYFGSDIAKNVSWVRHNYTFNKAELEHVIEAHTGAIVYGDRFLEGLRRDKSIAKRILDMAKTGDISAGETKAQYLANYMSTYNVSRKEAEQYYNKNIEQSNKYILVKHNSFGASYADTDIHIFKRDRIAKQISNKEKIYSILSDYSKHTDKMYEIADRASEDIVNNVRDSIDKNFNYDKFKNLSGEEQSHYLLESVLGKPLYQIKDVSPQIQEMLGVGMSILSNKGVDISKINTSFYRFTPQALNIKELKEFTDKTVSGLVNDLVKDAHTVSGGNVPIGAYGGTMSMTQVKSNARMNDSLKSHADLLIAAAQNTNNFAERHKLLEAVKADTGYEMNEVAEYVNPILNSLANASKKGGRILTEAKQVSKTVSALNLGEMRTVLSQKMRTINIGATPDLSKSGEQNVLAALSRGDITTAADFSKKDVLSVAEHFGLGKISDYTTLAIKLAQQNITPGEQTVGAETYGKATSKTMINLLDGMLKVITTQRQILEDMKKSLEH